MTLAVLAFLLYPGLSAYFFIKPSFIDDGSVRRLQNQLAARRGDYLGSLGGCVEDEPVEEADLSLPPLPKGERAEAAEEEETRDLLSVRRGAPTELKDVGDLEGCWEVEPGFTSGKYGRRMFHKYCFDAFGNATSYSANLSPKGKVRDDCRNTAKARLTGKDFVLRERRPPPCPGWRAGVYTCKLVAKGVMQCGLDHGGPIDYTKFYFKGRRK
jgi:hypothetical protein